VSGKIDELRKREIEITEIRRTRTTLEEAFVKIAFGNEP
jgi:hypothetical protein